MPPGKYYGNRGHVGHGLIILAIQFCNFNYILSHSAVLCTGGYSVGYWIPNWRTTQCTRRELLKLSRGKHQRATVSCKQWCHYKMSWLTLNPISPHIFRLDNKATFWLSNLCKYINLKQTQITILLLLVAVLVLFLVMHALPLSPHHTLGQTLLPHSDRNNFPIASSMAEFLSA